MKSIVLVTVCIFVPALATHPDIQGAPNLFEYTSDEDFEACKESTGVTINEIKSLLENTDKVAEKTFCFIKCMAEKQKYINPDGTINIEYLENRPKPKGENPIDKNVDECLGKAGKITNCSDMVEIHKCVIKGVS